jgi:hypothetical protein
VKEVLLQRSQVLGQIVDILFFPEVIVEKFYSGMIFWTYPSEMAFAQLIG